MLLERGHYKSTGKLVGKIGKNKSSAGRRERSDGPYYEPCRNGLWEFFENGIVRKSNVYNNGNIMQ